MKPLLGGVLGWGCVLACVMTGACLRTVLPAGAAQNKGQGEACSAPEVCGSGFCQDGVCCDARCESSQACNLARSLGSCVARDLGDACAGAQHCPSGHCVDGVCCDGACAGFCESCNGPSSPGRCGLAPDNTDERRVCATGCTACFGGLCSPALPGTDPGHACDAGLACGVSGACQLAIGAACVPPGDCAAGICLGAACTVPRLEAVTADILVPDAYFTVPLALSVDNAHNAALVVQQLSLGQPHDQPNPIATANIYYLRRGTAGWDGFLLEQPDYCLLDPRPVPGHYSPAAMVSVGGADVVFLSTAFPQCAPLPGGPSVEVVWTGPSLTVHRKDHLYEGTAQTRPSANGALPYEHLDAQFDGTDTLLLSWGFTVDGAVRTFPLHVWTYRISQGVWNDPVEVTPNAHQWGTAVSLDGQGVVFWAPTWDRVEAAGLTEHGVQSLTGVTMPADCEVSGTRPLAARVVEVAGGGHAAWLLVHCVTTAGVVPLLLPFSLAGGFGSPATFAEPEVGGLGNFTLARVAPEYVAVPVFDRFPGRMALVQMGAGQGFVSTPLTHPLLWDEGLNAVLAAYADGRPVLAWSADRTPVVPDGGVPSLTATTSSRMFTWQPR